MNSRRMIATTLAAIGWFLVFAAPAAFSVEPLPESEQGPLALKILDTFHGTRPAVSPKKLHIVYFTPSDREPQLDYRERLNAVLEDIRSFYRDGMERAGFGSQTFDLAREADGGLIIQLVKGSEPESAYTRSGFQQDRGTDAGTRDKIIRESRTVLRAAGISLEAETVLIFCNLATWDAKARSFSHHSPYAGFWNKTGGLCFAVDSVILNVSDLPKKQPLLKDAEWGNESLGKFNTVFIGGIAHELGHAFALPHCGERWDEKSRGVSIMGAGNHAYREELRGEGPGAFLAMASAMKLAGRPLFSKSDKALGVKPRLEKQEFQLSTNVQRSALIGRRGALRVDGTVKATPPVYGVIAYFDSLRDGGYRAPAATAVPDAEGHFAIEVSDLASCANGEVRIEFCHVNGATSEARAPFKVSRGGILNLDQSEIAKTLEPVIRAVLDENAKAARSALDTIENSAAQEPTKNIARKLAATLDDTPKPIPADVPTPVTNLPLGDARAKTSEVGWLKPAANRIPANDQIPSPLLDSGEIYATGLFAHAPSRYVFDLGGKWKKLRGEAGLHTLHQPYGSVVFIIKADGKEIFHSATIRESTKAKYDVEVKGVKLLELVVTDAGNGNGNDWGLWLDPTLMR